MIWTGYPWSASVRAAVMPATPPPMTIHAGVTPTVSRLSGSWSLDFATDILTILMAFLGALSTGIERVRNIRNAGLFLDGVHDLVDLDRGSDVRAAVADEHPDPRRFTHNVLLRGQLFYNGVRPPRLCEQGHDAPGHAAHPAE